MVANRAERLRPCSRLNTLIFRDMSRQLRTVTNRRVERVAGIEPAYSAWKAAALPLCYTRVAHQTFGIMAPAACGRKRDRAPALVRRTSAFGRCPQEWWRGLDLNQRRENPADLQSAAIDRSATPPNPSVREAGKWRMRPILSMQEAQRRNRKSRSTRRWRRIGAPATRRGRPRPTSPSIAWNSPAPPHRRSIAADTSRCRRHGL